MASNKIRHSDFLVTINTNFRPKDRVEMDEVQSALERAVEDMSTPSGLREVVRVLEPNVTLTAANVKNVDVEYAGEVGESAKGGRVHSHTIIKVTHTTKIQMDPKKISSFVMASIESPHVKNVHVNIKLLPTNGYAEDYLHKKAESNPNSNP